MIWCAMLLRSMGKTFSIMDVDLFLDPHLGRHEKAISVLGRRLEVESRCGAAGAVFGACILKNCKAGLAT